MIHFKRQSKFPHSPNCMMNVLSVTLVALSFNSYVRGELARGIVFHDQNENGTLDVGEPGIANVRVSNGLEVVSTDASGRYQLPVDDDTIVFVMKPRNWQVPLNDHRLPQFYYIHKPAGSPDESFAFPGVDPTGPLPDSINFPLVPSEEPEDFSIIVMGDPQPYDREEVRFYANDVIAELVDCEARFGISLGDIVGDKLSLFEHVNAVQAKVGIPWYNVYGNHDMNLHSRNDEYADETFERVYGPTDYAFQWASVHFVLLDNVFWHGFTTDENGKVSNDNYVGKLRDEQLQFVQNYVSKVPADELIVVCTHIPLINPTSSVHGTPQLAQLLEILAKHPHQMSFSAHTHYNRHSFVADHRHDHGDHRHGNIEHPHHHFQLHHHHNTATASGSWYRGPKDEYGFPMTPMRDGVPNGYVIASFSGNQYKLRYKAARMPADFQMSIHAPPTVAVSKVEATEILANVFNGNEKSKVRMRVRGVSTWVPMSQVEKEDPGYRAMYERDQAYKDRPHTALPKPLPTPHLWAATLPAGIGAGVHILEVESKDMFGQVDRGIRLIEVNADTAVMGSDKESD